MNDLVDNCKITGDVLLDDVDKKYFLNSTRSRELINQLIIDGKIEKETEQGNF